MNTGSITMFAGSTAPTGWLMCDGSAVSRSTYSSLFEIIGTQYGEGDGLTTFNLPNLTGRVIIGASQNHPLSTVGGEEEHALINDEMAEHYHNVQQHGHANNLSFTTPSLSHTITQASFNYDAPGSTIKSGVSSSQSNYSAYSGTSSATATRSANVAIANHAASNCTMSGSVVPCDPFDTESVGIGSSHDNMQPYITLNYIIYVGE